VQLLAPFDYLETQRALARASLVLTDSGGLQEEAPTYKVPVIVLGHENRAAGRRSKPASPRWSGPTPDGCVLARGRCWRTRAAANG
jgi:hypothetical protein